MRRLGVISASILLLIFAIPRWSDSTDITFSLPVDPLSGLRVFTNKNCISCHSLKSGEVSFGPDLKKSLKDNDIMQIYGRMWSHSLQMFRYMDEKNIPHPQFEREEIKELLDFLFFLNFLSEKGEPEKGREFFEKNVCSQCHYIGNYGNKKGISLNAYKVYMSPVGLTAALWNHGPKMISKVSTEHINWPRVTGEELSSLAEFIKNFSTEPVSKKLFSPAGSPMEGRKIFQKFSCNRCHSEQNFDVVAGKNVLEISAEMWNNGPKMWTKMLEVGYNIPEFTPEDFINLTSYLYFIQYPWKRGNSMEGKKIFEKNCAQCHTEGPGPSIKKIKGKYDHLGFILAIWNHTENMHDIAKEKGITWPRFLSYEMNHLVEYMTEK